MSPTPQPKRRKLLLCWMLTPVLLLGGMVFADHQASAARADPATSESGDLAAQFE